MAKFLQFQLTVNIAAIVIASVGAIWLNRSPLQPVQMLWVNLIMDSFASLALATEPPHERLLDRAPYGRNKAMISRQMWFNMLGHSVYQLIVIMVMLVDGHNLFDVPDGRFTDHNDPPTKHFTIIFNTFVLMQLFNEFNSRKLYGEWNVFEGLANNAIFLIIVIGTVGAQIIIVQFGGRAFTCEALSAEQWGWCILFGFLELPWQFVVNLVVEYVVPLPPVCRAQPLLTSGVPTGSCLRTSWSRPSTPRLRRTTAPTSRWWTLTSPSARRPPRRLDRRVPPAASSPRRTAARRSASTSRLSRHVEKRTFSAWWHACTSLVLMCVLLRLQKGGEGYPADLSALWLGPVSCFVDV